MKWHDLVVSGVTDFNYSRITNPKEIKNASSKHAVSGEGVSEDETISITRSTSLKTDFLKKRD